MKVLGVLTVLLIAGCGTMVPLEELERQAFLTGDWSAVEKRELAIQRRQARRGPQCARGLTAVCDGRIRIERCVCVDSSKMQGVLFGR